MVRHCKSGLMSSVSGSENGKLDGGKDGWQWGVSDTSLVHTDAEVSQDNSKVKGKQAPQLSGLVRQNLGSTDGREGCGKDDVSQYPLDSSSLAIRCFSHNHCLPDPFHTPPMLGIKPRALQELGKCFTTERLPPNPPNVLKLHCQGSLPLGVSMWLLPGTFGTPSCFLPSMANLELWCSGWSTDCHLGPWRPEPYLQWCLGPWGLCEANLSALHVLPLTLL
jgi:hypothetical protein